MIGQELLLDKLNKYKQLPIFMIFEGPKGCGKKTLAKELANKYSLNYILVGTKVDDILSMIKIANNSVNNLFFIDNGNDLLPNAENTLLKITEELPNNNYIILSCEMSILLLPTIISRGELFTFQDYTEEDFKQYLGKREIDFDLSMVCPNLSYVSKNMDLGNVRNLLMKCYTLIDFNRFTEKGIFKLMEFLYGYNLDQFLYCLEKICRKEMLTSIKNNDKIIITQLMKLLEIISKVKKLIYEGITYNRKYIIDYMTLRYIEEFIVCK